MHPASEFLIGEVWKIFVEKNEQNQYEEEQMKSERASNPFSLPLLAYSIAGCSESSEAYC